MVYTKLSQVFSNVRSLMAALITFWNTVEWSFPNILRMEVTTVVFRISHNVYPSYLSMAQYVLSTSLYTEGNLACEIGMLKIASCCILLVSSIILIVYHPDCLCDSPQWIHLSPQWYSCLLLYRCKIYWSLSQVASQETCSVNTWWSTICLLVINVDIFTVRRAVSVARKARDSHEVILDVFV